ncbi:MAG: AAA family ATPase [Acidimicrobiia bacterium]|nr:AAA family ATPase [Acidimicrobiia bacterium]
MEEHDSTDASPAEAAVSEDPPVSGGGRVFGGSVDPSAAASAEEQNTDEPVVAPESDTESVPADVPGSEPVAAESAEPSTIEPDDTGDAGSAGTDAPEPTAADAAVAGPSSDPAGGSAESEAPDEEADDGERAVIPYDLPRIFAIANQKGGVGKTTTSVNLGASLADLGFRVLVVDLDPQGNATTGLGVNAREIEGSIYDVIMSDTNIEDCIEPTSLKNLFVCPATIDLAGAEIELVPAFSRELKLRRALHDIREDYDYILIDCPPSLGLLTVNGLAAADDVLVPIQCEYYALEGLSQLIRNVTLVRTNLNPTLDVRGIVLTMYDARTKLADQVEQEVRNHFGRTVYLTVIPRTVRLSEAPSFGQPIILFDPTSRGAVAYRELAKEVSSGATRRTG